MISKKCSIRKCKLCIIIYMIILKKVFQIYILKLYKCSRVCISDVGFKRGHLFYNSPKRTFLNIFSIHIHHSWNTWSIEDNIQYPSLKTKLENTIIKISTISNFSLPVPIPKMSNFPVMEECPMCNFIVYDKINARASFPIDDKFFCGQILHKHLYLNYYFLSRSAYKLTKS